MRCRTPFPRLRSFDNQPGTATHGSSRAAAWARSNARSAFSPFATSYPTAAGVRTPVRRNTCPLSGRTDRHVTAGTALTLKPGVTTT